MQQTIMHGKLPGMLTSIDRLQEAEGMIPICMKGLLRTICTLGSELIMRTRLTTPASRAAPRFSLSRCTSSISSNATCAGSSSYIG
jgi:hypothetical protein